ncbi:unnamed protein product, partial [marine sediment metagenome]
DYAKRHHGGYLGEKARGQGRETKRGGEGATER